VSIDVTLTISTGGPESVSIFERDHTSNTSGMWKNAGCDLREFDGHPAKELAAPLAIAMSEIARNPDYWQRTYGPANGWGDVRTTLDFLRDLLVGCTLHPDATVRVS